MLSIIDPQAIGNTVMLPGRKALVSLVRLPVKHLAKGGIKGDGNRTYRSDGRSEDELKIPRMLPTM